ncbi:FHA domain-containing protein [Candidatus Gracilibacteria bacterium]|nr:FHA domain-containing protein [Candidatus Gracilibacteria bacterium]
MDYGKLIVTRPGAAEQRAALRIGSFTIGSDAANNVTLSDAAVSAYHARIICTPNSCSVSDLGSQSGTFVNMVRLQPHTPQPLRHHDQLKIGPFTLRYHAAGIAETATPPPTPSVDKPTATAQPATRQGSQPPSQATPRAGVQEQQHVILPPDIAAQLSFASGGGNGGDRTARLLRGNRGPRRMMPGERQLKYSADDYLALLPPIYHDDPFLSRYLLIFKSILDPIERMIGQVDLYFDPRIAPEQLLPWLATWVDLVLNEKWPLERRRELIGYAATLYRWRGTRRGLSDYLRIYTGTRPRIVEPGQERNGEAKLSDHTFAVYIEVADPAQLDRDLIERIIEAEKPAHAAYTLQIGKNG